MFKLIYIILAFIGSDAVAQNWNDIVIDEIMADPSPVVGLPASEWIELRNTSGAVINLAGWRLGDLSGMSGPIASVNLKPDSCLVICATGSVSTLSPFGNVAGVTSFPSLDNAGDQLYIKSPAGKTIFALEYTSAWYRNTVKSEGGWTLEMIDCQFPCSGDRNWLAATDPRGGTPGKINSVNGNNPDRNPPRLLHSFAIDAFHITLNFDKSLDSPSAVIPQRYAISDGVGPPQSVSAVAPMLAAVTLTVVKPLEVSKVYMILVSGIGDCKNNQVAANSSCRVGLAVPPDSADIAINEILFNPKPDSYDYIELYNKGNHILDIKNLMLANRSNTGLVSSVKSVANDSRLFFPGDYLVITEDPTNIMSRFVVKDSNAIIGISALPSFPDDKGHAIVLSSTGTVLDDVSYNAKWHFGLVANPEGIALERIDPVKATNDPNNWTSAASSAGYGTPGYRNSQWKNIIKGEGAITVTPAIFSPDNDGNDDFALLIFEFPEPGYVANITIYDAAGRPVKALQKNTSCAATGSFRWDGLDDRSAKVPVGIYILFTEIFDLKGTVKRFKNTVAVARYFG